MRLNTEQKNKLCSDHIWNHEDPMERITFNKNMRKKMKQWLAYLPDMILILKGLPSTVIENAKLTDDLPNLINFMDLILKNQPSRFGEDERLLESMPGIVNLVDIFLEKANPLPIGEVESGQKCVFLNQALHCKSPDAASTPIGEEDFMVRSISWKATPKEEDDCELLRNHIEKVRRFIDPNVVAITSEDKEIHDPNAFLSSINSRAKFIGTFHLHVDLIEPGDNIKTKHSQHPIFIDYRGMHARTINHLGGQP